MRRREFATRAIALGGVGYLAGCSGIGGKSEEERIKEQAIEDYESGYAQFRDGETYREEGDSFFRENEWSRAKRLYSDAKEAFSSAQEKFGSARERALEVRRQEARQIAHNAAKRAISQETYAMALHGEAETRETYESVRPEEPEYQGDSAEPDDIEVYFSTPPENTPDATNTEKFAPRYFEQAIE